MKDEYDFSKGERGKYVGKIEPEQKDEINSCAVCGKEIPPGPDCCSKECQERFDYIVSTNFDVLKARRSELRWQRWRAELQRLWAIDARATITALLEGGPDALD